MPKAAAELAARPTPNGAGELGGFIRACRHEELMPYLEGEGENAVRPLANRLAHGLSPRLEQPSPSIEGGRKRLVAPLTDRLLDALLAITRRCGRRRLHLLLQPSHIRFQALNGARERVYVGDGLLEHRKHLLALAPLPCLELRRTPGAEADRLPTAGADGKRGAPTDRLLALHEPRPCLERYGDRSVAEAADCARVPLLPPVGTATHNVAPRLEDENRTATAQSRAAPCQQRLSVRGETGSELGPCKVGGAEQAMAQAQHGAASHLLRSTGTLGQERPRREDSREQPLRPAPYSTVQFRLIVRVLLELGRMHRVSPRVQRRGEHTARPAVDGAAGRRALALQKSFPSFKRRLRVTVLPRAQDGVELGLALAHRRLFCGAHALRERNERPHKATQDLLEEAFDRLDLAKHLHGLRKIHDSRAQAVESLE